MLSDKEISDLLKKAADRSGIRVSMSKEGVFLTVNKETHEISDMQAEILFHVLQGGRIE